MAGGSGSICDDSPLEHAADSILRLISLAALAALAALVACSTAVPNPTPSYVDVVLAGRSVADLRALESGDREYFLGAMRWCDWQQEGYATPGSEYMFEIRPPEGRGIFVYVSGSKLHVGRNYCELPPSTASQIRQMVFPKKR